MGHRKIWVMRPGSSPTQVTVAEDDLVDDVRDVILRKYTNSLGRNFDSPDVILKVCTREDSNKNEASARILGPEEAIGATLDACYPGGQRVEEALIIDVPQRRTPRPSPRAGHHMSYFIPEEIRPGEGAGDYFPPMAVMQSPHLNPHATHPGNHHHPGVHSMAVLTTGQLPTLSSPGARSHRHHARPKYGRQHTSSPTTLHGLPPNGSMIDPKQSINGVAAPSAPPLPTPPPQTHNDRRTSVTIPHRSSSPHPGDTPKKWRKTTTANVTNSKLHADHPPSKPASSGLLDGAVPPINVLIVEDNVINLKLLEAFMKRLKVRWKTAMNGQEAVTVWRTGGFHLVLMDIQLPVMNGLDATKEIRRLEGVNGIGVFSGSPIDGNFAHGSAAHEIAEDDKLGDRSLFKSPVIIVALTASSLQSDRHEALAAGCNDFLTKPVNFVWMERKVTEWGCMQALIDFDGWRKWKDYAAKDGPKKDDKEEKAAAKAALKAMFSTGPPKKSDKKPRGTGPTSSRKSIVGTSNVEKHEDSDESARTVVAATANGKLKK